MIATKQNDTTEKRLVVALLKAWSETRALTYDLINETPLEKLNEKIARPGLDSIAKQIYELGLVQMAYVDVLAGKPLDFSATEDITFGNKEYIAKSKQELSAPLKDADARLKMVAGEVENWGKEFTLFGESAPAYSILDLMTRHEILHQGQFVIFCYLLEIKFPESWVNAWALPQKQ